MAEGFGKRLLEEVTEESLEDLLRSFHSLRERPFLGVSPLSNLIDHFLGLDGLESHSDPISPLKPQTNKSPVAKKPQIIELTSAHPGSGKTQILYYLVSVALLPPPFGHDGTVVWIDTSNTFSIRRLHHVLSVLTSAHCSSHVQHWIDTTSMTLPVPAASKEIPEVVSGSDAKQTSPSSAMLTALGFYAGSLLDHLHVFNPQSSTSLLSTLDSIPDYLLNQNMAGTTVPHHSSGRKLALVILGDASTFFYADRHDAELQKEGYVGTGVPLSKHVPITSDPSSPSASQHEPRAMAATTNNPLTPLYSRLISSLTNLAETFLCPIVCAQRGLSIPEWTGGSANNRVAIRPLLPSVWENAMSVKLVIGIEEHSHKFPDNSRGWDATPIPDEIQAHIARKKKGWIRLNAWDSNVDEWKKRKRVQEAPPSAEKIEFWLGKDGVDWIQGDL